MNRQAPNLYNLAFNYFCGIKRTMSPLALEEIRKAGFSPAVRPDNYVEDSSETWRAVDPMDLGPLTDLGCSP